MSVALLGFFWEPFGHFDGGPAQRNLDFSCFDGFQAVVGHLGGLFGLLLGSFLSFSRGAP